MAFRVIPVIDLRGGVVVRARKGDRDAYAPIITPLASSSRPADVARRLLDAYPSDTLYVADLDAIIDGAAPDTACLAAIRDACPGTAIWLDAGFAEAGTVERFLAAGLGRPVLGSESQSDVHLVETFARDCILSLDSRGDERLGPIALHREPALWPREVIVMTLARVGGGAGPDLAAITNAVRARPDARIFAAGGVRGSDDVAALERAGAAGALVASAIHDGTLLPANRVG